MVNRWLSGCGLSNVSARLNIIHVPKTEIPNISIYNPKRLKLLRALGASFSTYEDAFAGSLGGVGPPRPGYD
jgi:hypothetical protein